MYDYGARHYMSDIGRWGVQDMLGSFTLDPYSYANNNPIFFNDPTGMIGECPTCPKEIDPNKPGGTNNPYLIQEVVITKVTPIPLPSSASSPAYMPSNCSTCYAGSGLSVNLPEVQYAPPINLL